MNTGIGGEVPVLAPNILGSSQTHIIEGKPVLRPSSGKIGCWYRWARETLVRDVKKRNNAYNVSGTASHYCAEYAMLKYWADGEVPTVQELGVVAVKNWELAKEKSGELTYKQGDTESTVTHAVIQSANLIHQRIVQVAPNVIAVEPRLTAPLPKASSEFSAVSGSCDRVDRLADGSLSIRDYKNATRKPNAKDHSLQQSVYAMLMESMYPNEKVAGAGLEALIRPTTKNDARLELVEVEIDYGKALHRIVEQIDMAELWNYAVTQLGVDPVDALGVFTCSDPSTSNLCSPLWCDMWEHCPHIRGEVTKFSIVDLLKRT